METKELVVLMARSDAAREFAQETVVKIDEFTKYTELGILGDEMIMTLQAEIEARIIAVDIELQQIRKATRTILGVPDEDL